MTSTQSQPGLPHNGATSSLADASARERLLRAAAELFCRFGINATGVDAVVAAAGTAKATLYKAFGSKEGLIEAVLEMEGAAWRDWLLMRIEQTPGDAKDKLLGIFDALEGWFRDARFFGCPFINAVGEFDKRDTRIKEIALQHKRVVLARIEDLARDAGSVDPAATAHQFGLIVDGAIVAALITGDATVARHARIVAAKLLST